MTTARPNPARLAEAEQRAQERREIVPGSTWDGSRILALDVLLEFIEGIYDGDRGQVAWALLWAEGRDDLEEHEAKLREDAWAKIHDDADRAEWERLGLRR